MYHYDCRRFGTCPLFLKCSMGASIRQVNCSFFDVGTVGRSWRCSCKLFIGTRFSKNDAVYNYPNISSKNWGIFFSFLSPATLLAVE